MISRKNDPKHLNSSKFQITGMDFSKAGVIQETESAFRAKWSAGHKSFSWEHPSTHNRGNIHIREIYTRTGK